MKAHVDPRAINHNGNTFHLVPRTIAVEKKMLDLQHNSGLTADYEVEIAVLKILLQDGEFLAAYPVEDEIDLDDLDVLYWAVIDKYKSVKQAEMNKRTERKYADATQKMNAVTAQVSKLKNTVVEVAEMGENNALHEAFN